MYTRFAERQHWQVEVISQSPSEAGGYKEIIAKIIGNGTYSKLKFESGGHRVQRVPATETQGRIHTSACTVAVMPEADEIMDVVLNPAELRIDTFVLRVQAASISTRQIPQCGSLTCRPTSWLSARMGVRSTKTRPRR